MKRNNKNNTEVQYTIFQIIFKRIDLYREHDQTQAHKKHLQAKVRDQRPDKKDSARKRKFNMKASRSSDFNIAQADERTPPHSPSFQIVNMVVYVSACVCVQIRRLLYLALLIKSVVLESPTCPVAFRIHPHAHVQTYVCTCRWDSLFEYPGMYPKDFLREIDWR